MWAEIYTVIKQKRCLSTASYPQTDRQTEQQNQTLETYLRIFVNNQQDNWASLLLLVEFAYNNSKYSATRMSPFRVVYKDWQPRVSWEYPGLDEVIRANKGLKIRGLQDCLEQFQRACDLVSKYFKDAMVVQKKYYDAQHEPIEFGISDFVLLSTKNLNIKRPKGNL